MKNYLTLTFIFILFLKNFGQVGIGTSSPNSSAILDLDVSSFSDTNKKGFLGPRVALKSNTDSSTIPNPVAGLLVYNTGTDANFPFKGYMYWDGSSWLLFSKSLAVAPSIAGIVSTSATLSPATYVSGTAYKGTLEVTYTGGNGGSYSAENQYGGVNSVYFHGLKFKLQPGTLSNGNGKLVYDVEGIPTVSSPEVTTPLIMFLGKSWGMVEIGGGGIAPGDLVYYKASFSSNAGGWMSDYVSDLPILGGSLRLDAWFSGASNGGNQSVTMYPRLVNVSESPVKIWFSALTTVDRFNAGNYLLAGNGGYVELDNGIYYGLGYNDVLGVTTPRATGSGQAGHQEVLTLDLAVSDKWYRVYYFPIVNNNNTSSTTDNTREIFLSIQRLY